MAGDQGTTSEFDIEFAETWGIYKIVPHPFLIPRRWQERYVLKTLEKTTQRLGERPFLASLRGMRDKKMAQAMAFYRAKNRVRMLVLYFYSELENLLVVGTANRSEWLTGFFVQYGDGAADIMPLLPLYKTQVRQIAQFLHLPDRILHKPPVPISSQASLMKWPSVSLMKDWI